MSSTDAASGRIRVLRIFHAGRNPTHRSRDRALLEVGVDVVYVVPRVWPEIGSEIALSREPFPMCEVELRRSGNVNGHCYADADAVANLVVEYRADLVDLFEEPFSRAAGQLLPRLPVDVPVVMYSAQNLDKRWPPPFGDYERRSFRRVQAFYPCSRQAASVLRGKGYGGLIQPLALGYDDAQFFSGQQSLADETLQLALVGRMVPEKGVLDAVRVLTDLRRHNGVDARLVLAGSGPALAGALGLAGELEVAEHVEHRPWLAMSDLAELYRATHVVLTPSQSTATWVEQFGRMIVEAQASGCVVVGYDSGSIGEVGGAAARLVGEGDVDALAAAAGDVLGDEGEFQSRRRAGLSQARERTWASVARRQLALYQAALGRAPGPLLTGSPRVLRQMAVAEFGPPAEALGQLRPFALAGLRRPNAATRSLGRALDVLAEVRTKPGPVG